MAAPPIPHRIDLTQRESPATVTLPGGVMAARAHFSRFGNDLHMDLPDGRSVILTGWFAAGADGGFPTLITGDGIRIPGVVASRLATLQQVPDAAPAHPAEDAVDALPPVIGHIDSITGTATVQRADGTQQLLASGVPVYPGDMLVTAPHAALGIAFADRGLLSLGGGARLVLTHMDGGPESGAGIRSMDLLQGRCFMNDGLRFDAVSHGTALRTPTADITARGAAYGVSVDAADGSSAITLFAGAVSVANEAGARVLDSARTALRVARFDAQIAPPHPVDPIEQAAEFADAIMLAATAAPLPPAYDAMPLQPVGSWARDGGFAPVTGRVDGRDKTADAAVGESRRDAPDAHPMAAPLPAPEPDAQTPMAAIPERHAPAPGQPRGDAGNPGIPDGVAHRVIPAEPVRPADAGMASITELDLSDPPAGDLVGTGILRIVHAGDAVGIADLRSVAFFGFATLDVGTLPAGITALRVNATQLEGVQSIIGREGLSLAINVAGAGDVNFSDGIASGFPGLTVTGDDLANRMTGSPGNDNLIGGAGPDGLVGSAGSDRFPVADIAHLAGDQLYGDNDDATELTGTDRLIITDERAVTLDLTVLQELRGIEIIDTSEANPDARLIVTAAHLRDVTTIMGVAGQTLHVVDGDGHDVAVPAGVTLIGMAAAENDRDARDGVFQALQLWDDGDMGGLTDPGELRTLADRAADEGGSPDMCLTLADLIDAEGGEDDNVALLLNHRDGATMNDTPVADTGPDTAMAMEPRLNGFSGDSTGVGLIPDPVITYDV